MEWALLLELLALTGGDINMPTAGYYLFKADTDPAKLTYSATELLGESLEMQLQVDGIIVQQ